MSTAVLLGAELLLGLLAGALWVLAGTRSGRAIVVVAGGATVVGVVHLAAVALLLGRGWWFAGEKVLVGVPLAVLGLVAATALLVRDARRARSRSVAPSPATRTALFGCGYAHLGGVVLVLVIGYPVGPLDAAVIVLLVAAACTMTYLVLVGRPARLVETVAAVAVMLVAVAVGRAWFVDLATAPALGVGGHAHGSGGAGAASAVSVTELRGPDGPADVRAVLVARQQQLTLPSGKTVEAWTFGSVPGPTITARVGDLVEVVLHNDDVDAGVTLHWHGY